MSIRGRLQLLGVRGWLWLKTQAQSTYAKWWLAGLAFIETILFPIPVDPLLAAMVLADTRRWKFLAGLATLASFGGAVIGYVVGFFAFDAIGRPLLAVMGVEDGFMAFKEVFNEHGFVLMFASALTPLPNIVVPAGFFGMNLISFLAAWSLGRAVRFFGVSYIVYAYGADTLSRAERYLRIGTVVFTLFFIGWITLSIVQPS